MPAKPLQIIELNPTTPPPDFVGDEPMLKASHVARMLGLHTATIHKMAQRGQIPSYRFGNARRFLRSDIVEAIQRFKEGSHGTATQARRRR